MSIGYPGPVRDGKPSADPWNLGHGWVGFDFAKAFGKPVRMVNDAAMQALGSYEGGTMLFLGLGTGLGTTMIHRRNAHSARDRAPPVSKGQDVRGVPRRRGVQANEKRRVWRKHVLDVIDLFVAASRGRLRRPWRRQRAPNEDAAVQRPTRQQCERVQGRVSPLGEGRVRRNCGKAEPRVSTQGRRGPPAEGAENDGESILFRRSRVSTSLSMRREQKTHRFSGPQFVPVYRLLVP